MAFRNSGSLDPHGGPLLRSGILANSTTFTEHDSMIWDTDGFMALGSAGVGLLGHADSLTDINLVGLTTDGSGGNFAGTILTASDNETVGLLRAQVNISQLTLYSAEVDAALETTGGSGQIGIYMDLIDEDTLDESDVTDSTAQYHSWGADPADATRLIVNVFESSPFTSAT